MDNYKQLPIGLTTLSVFSPTGFTGSTTNQKNIYKQLRIRWVNYFEHNRVSFGER